METPPKAPDELVAALAVLSAEGQVSESGNVYAGQAARYIAALEGMLTAEILARCSVQDRLIDRIEALESRPVPDSIDNRHGLSVSEVVELTRALRNKD